MGRQRADRRGGFRAGGVFLGLLRHGRLGDPDHASPGRLHGPGVGGNRRHRCGARRGLRRAVIWPGAVNLQGMPHRTGGRVRHSQIAAPFAPRTGGSLQLTYHQFLGFFMDPRTRQPPKLARPHLLTRYRVGPNKGGTMSLPLRMLVVALAIGSCQAGDIVSLPNNTVMRLDRSLVSIKAGTAVEVMERGDKTISIPYKGQTGTIPASSLTAVPRPPAAAAQPAPRPAATAAKPASPAPHSLVADQPQSVYGNLVKKAETAVAKHDENLVKPANAATDGTPSN